MKRLTQTCLGQSSSGGTLASVIPVPNFALEQLSLNTVSVCPRALAARFRTATGRNLLANKTIKPSSTVELFLCRQYLAKRQTA